MTKRKITTRKTKPAAMNDVTKRYMLDGGFVWYRSNGDGTATVVPDSPEVCALIDAGASGYFGSIECAILHGGVRATAFKAPAPATIETVPQVSWSTTERPERDVSIEDTNTLPNPFLS